MSTAAHFGVGAACGAVFAALPKPRSLPPAVQGALYGLAVWAVTYAGAFPALGILPRPEDSPGRSATMLPAHLVYGATLGPVLHRLSRS